MDLIDMNAANPTGAPRLPDTPACWHRFLHGQPDTMRRGAIHRARLPGRLALDFPAIQRAWNPPRGRDESRPYRI
jgi:hypothetical protein